MTADILQGPAHEIVTAVAARRVSARQVTEAAIARIEATNERLGALTDFTFARALREADEVDAAIAAGAAPPLAGVPYAVKNLFDVEGLTTRAGSLINRDNPPAKAMPISSAACAPPARCCSARSTWASTAYDFTGENAHDGNSRNPHDPSRMSGGSSGGAGTAVAAGMVAAALGSDTNGSIRVPASFCGLFGLKPTFGRLSRGGSFPFVASLDHVGPLTRSAVDLAILFDALQGDDPADPAQIKRPPVAAVHEIGRGIAGLRIATAGGYFRERGEPQAFAALDKVASALGATREVVLPEAARARAAAYLITTAELSALHLDRLRKRAADFDPAVRDRLIAGAMVPAVWLVQAQRFRSWFREAMRKVFADVDIILAPATPFPALTSGTQTVTLGGVAMPARPNIGIFTQPISLAGLPVVAVPVWLDGATLPIGVQVIAPAWREDLALRVARHLELAGVVAAPVAESGGMSKMDDSKARWAGRDGEKDRLRADIWGILETKAVNVGPVRSRIPNFAGADLAAWNLARAPAWATARVVKCNPDPPQIPVRLRALHDGKIVYAPVPELNKGFPFVRLDPARLAAKGIDFELAATSQGFLTHGDPVEFEEMEKLDLVVVGCVAVTRAGGRTGKGGGFADLELGIFRELGKVGPETPIATTVHSSQVVDDRRLPMLGHDSALNFIATETELIDTRTPYGQPTGVDWDRVQPDQYENIPFLKELRARLDPPALKPLQIDIPAVKAEVEAAFAEYERALTGNDVAALDRFFLDRPTTVRYGVTENFYGYVAIAAFRAARSPAGLARTLEQTVITTYGADFAAASTLFRRASMPGKVGRQTQVWVRTPAGWRVAAAHISVIDDPG